MILYPFRYISMQTGFCQNERIFFCRNARQQKPENIKRKEETDKKLSPHGEEKARLKENQTKADLGGCEETPTSGETVSAVRLVPTTPAPPPKLVPDDADTKEQGDLREAREGKSFAVRMRQHDTRCGEAAAAFPFFTEPKASPSSSSASASSPHPSSIASSSLSPTDPPPTSSTSKSSASLATAFDTEDTDSGDATPPSNPQTLAIRPPSAALSELRPLQGGDGTPFMQWARALAVTTRHVRGVTILTNPLILLSGPYWVP